MKAACLHCHAKLKANDVIEAFPFGRRVAYDPAKQRFWVVCHKCGKWSMAPLADDARATVVEQLERWWRGSSQHYTAGGIGVGRHSDMFSVVRIGEATWPEFASWRYAEAIHRRNVIQSWRSGASGAFLIGTVAAGWMPPASALSLAIVFPLSRQLWPQMYLRDRKGICRVPTSEGTRELVRSKHLADMEIERTSGGWVLNTMHDNGTATLDADEGIRALSYALGRINYIGANRKTVEAGLKIVDESGGPVAMVEKAARVAPAKGSAAHAMLPRYPLPTRIALELASREMRERHELENELAILAHEWREAEEIAEISDRLLPR